MEGKTARQKLLGVKEVAKYLGVSAITVYRWTRKNLNGLPAHRLGGLLKFDLGEVDRWISENRR